MKGKIRDLFQRLEQRLGESGSGFDTHFVRWAGEYLEESEEPGMFAASNKPVDVSRLASMIDHTLLKPEATVDDVRILCGEAMEHGFASVCVNPCYVSTAASTLAGSPVKTCTVAGFPLGASAALTKAFEARTAVEEGAREVDMVINVGLLKSNRYEAVEDDINQVVKSVKGASRSDAPALVKVILENALLTEEEIFVAGLLSAHAGADFIKTSTGFAKGGATPSDVALMRAVAAGRMGVKAAGGIRSREDAMAMIQQGASRIGASASVAIVKGLSSQSTY